ncbi:MLX-interacting protein [Thrips palmi]|uniref:MLX-interacting protein n=1 Tax=Thrips palmi TaxID=161013 RepID=A0A6P8YP39_THRPL|nr:MLX-interacting protein [Thrips palmi]
MMMYHKVAGVTTVVKEKEAIHSGHFMVSHFEAEEQDDEDEVAVPVPDEDVDVLDAASSRASMAFTPSMRLFQPLAAPRHGLGLDAQGGQGLGDVGGVVATFKEPGQHLSIETSLSKLFQCMSLAYRQKLTSPKWNRFKGIRLRWKEKIRLNNVIWRCWHMQFILKQSTLVCQFASPLDVDTHNKPEAVVLEGKYWKRKLAAVTAEYKKWRMYRRNRILGCVKDGPDMFGDVDMLDWQPDSNDSSSMMSMMVDQDYMEFMSDTLFSTIQSNQPFAFPDTREIAKGAGLADFIQPSLVQLQPNLDDFMDTLEPLQELFSYRLPPVPEEAIADDALLRSLPATSASYPDLSKSAPTSSTISLMSQLDQSSQSMGMYQHMNDPYRQPEYVSVESLGSESLGNKVTFSESDLQVPMQLIQQQHHPQLSQLPQQVQPIISKGRNVRPAAQTKSRALTQAPQQSIVRKQITHVPSHQQLPIQDQQRLHQQQQYQQQSQDQQSQAVGYQMYTPSSPILSHPQPPPLPPTMPESSPQPQGAQIKIQSQPYSNQVSPQLQPPLQTQQQVQQQTVISPEAFKFSTNVAQRSFSLPSTHTSSIAYASSGTNLRSVATSSMSNIHTASLNSVDKTPARSETELFAVPKYQKLRNRSRSGSSLLPGNSGSATSSSGVNTVGSGMAPRSMRPLVSASSNPDLSSAHSSALLAQLLSVNSSSVYNFTAGSDSPSGRVPISKSHIPILPMPTGGSAQQTQVPHTTALLITSSVPMTIQPSSSTGQLILNSAASTSTSSIVATGKGSDTASDSSAVPSPVGLSLSPLNMENMSPPTPLGSKSDTDLRTVKVSGRGEHRRVYHINAEQKRRCNIKNGFDTLHSLIPQLRQNPNTKTSKAAMLQKGAEYIKQLRGERNKLKDEMDELRLEIEKLNGAISNCQSMLPATGAPVSRHRASKMREMFEEYVRGQTLNNWKFWIFSLMVEPLLDSFNSTVSTSSVDELYRTTMQWVEKHCSLVELRPVVLNSLRFLCTSTEILSDPSRLPEEARQAVLKNEAGSSGASSSNASSSSQQPG